MEFWYLTHSQECTIAFSMEVDDGTNRVLAHLPCGSTIYFDNGNLNTTGRLAKQMPSRFLYNWHHLAFQVDSQAAAMRMFIDGKLFAETAAYDTNKPRDTDFLIGRAHQGSLGEFRIWDTVRTPAQIQETMPCAFTGPRPGLIAHWHLNNTLDNGGRIQNYSGHERHGVRSRR